MAKTSRAQKKKPLKSAPSKKVLADTSKPKRAIIARQWNVTEAQLTDDLSKDLLTAWKKLRAFAAGLGRQDIYASAQSIMFAKKVCYFYARPKKTAIEVWIFLPRHIEGLKFTATSGKTVRYCNLFKLVHVDQVEEPLTDWIREAFDHAPDLQ